MTEHQSSIDASSLIDTRKERVPTHDVPFFANDELQRPIPVDEFFRDNQEVVQSTRNLIAEAKRFVPVEADENMDGEKHKLRVIEEVIKRIQWRGDYMQGSDPLFSHLEDQDLEHTDLILIALEAQSNEIRKSLGESNVPDTVSMKRLIQSEAEARLIAATQPEQELPKPTGPEQEAEALTDIDEAPIAESSPTPEAPEPPLQTHFNFAVVAIPDRAVQDRRRAAAHSFNNNVNRRSRRDKVVNAVSETVGKLPIPIVNRVASRVTRGVGNVVSHPVQIVWQNNLAQDVFEQEHVRFATSLETTVKAHTDSSVPIAITEELIDIALKHAHDAREQQSRGQRTWDRLSDSVKAVTGVAQTSEQEMACEWLDRQLRLPATQRNRELQRVISQTYDEQTALAERFATPVPQGMDIERANIAGAIIRPELNERRTQLAKGSVAEERTNLELKKLIARYSKGEITDTESLVHQINRFIETEFICNLPAADRRAFSSPEVANNIILLAEEIKKDWEKYNKADDSGLSAWDKVHFDVYVGRAEWRAPRGPVERGWLTNWLTERLAENPSIMNRAAGGGFAILKDTALVPAVAYGTAWITSAISATGRTGARLAGGLASTFGLAGLRRSGIDLARLGRRGIEGGTVHDVALRSFESAYGRRFDNPEIQRVLVEQTPADEMTRNILRDSIRIHTDQDAIRLLAVLADARAKLHLTDLSDTRDLLYKTQNYIRYTEGHDNQESLELRRAIHNGVLAVEAYASSHGEFLTKYGGRVFSGMPTEYYHRGRRYRAPLEDMGMLERFTLIREAQLRFSSTDERRMRRWLQRTMRVPQNEIDSMMSHIHPFFAEQITRENSLRRKEARIQQLRAVQLAESVVDSAAATGMMISVVALASELPDMASHTIHGASTRGMSGLGEYVTHWREVMQGEASPETSLQRAVLAAREWWNRPQVAVPVEQAPVAGSGHDVVVSGTRIDLDPVTHKYDMIALGPDGNPILDAHGKPVLLIDNGQVDPTTGKVTADYIHPGITIQEYPPMEALTGQAGVEHWLKLSTKVDKIKWWVHNPKIEQHLYDSTSESTSGLRVLEFRLSNVGVALQGSESIDVGQLVQDNKIAFALTLPGHLHEPIIIDASSGVVHNGVLKLDPDDYSHFVKVGSEVRAVGDIARDLVKQQELSKFPTGNLGTDVLHREPLLHLSDANKAGHVQAVYIENQNGQVIEHSFSTIRAGGTVEIRGGPAASTPDIVLPNGMTIHVDNAQAVPFLQRIPAGFAPLQRAAGRLSDLALAAMPFGGHRNMDRSTAAQGPRSELEHRYLIENIRDARREYALAMEKVERNISRQQNLREVSRLRAELAIMQDKLRRSAYNQGAERRPAAPPSEIPPFDPGETPPPSNRPPSPRPSGLPPVPPGDLSHNELQEAIDIKQVSRFFDPKHTIELQITRILNSDRKGRRLRIFGITDPNWNESYTNLLLPHLRRYLHEGEKADYDALLHNLAEGLADALDSSNVILTRAERYRIAEELLRQVREGNYSEDDLNIKKQPIQEAPAGLSVRRTVPEAHGPNDIPPFMSQEPPETQPQEVPVDYMNITDPIESYIHQVLTLDIGHGIPQSQERVFRAEYRQHIIPAVQRAIKLSQIDRSNAIAQTDIASEVDMALKKVNVQLTATELLMIASKIIENINLQRFTEDSTEESPEPPQEPTPSITDIPPWLRPRASATQEEVVRTDQNSEVTENKLDWQQMEKGSAIRFIMQEVMEDFNIRVPASAEAVIREGYEREIVPLMRTMMKLSDDDARRSYQFSLSLRIESVLRNANIILEYDQSETIAQALIFDMNAGRLQVPDEKPTQTAAAEITPPWANRELNPPQTSSIPDWLREVGEPPADEVGVPAWLTELGEGEQIPARDETTVARPVPLYPDKEWFDQLNTIEVDAKNWDTPKMIGHASNGQIIHIEGRPIPFEIIPGAMEGLTNIRSLTPDGPKMEIMRDPQGYILNTDASTGVAYEPDKPIYGIIGDDVYQLKGTEFVPPDDESTAALIRERISKLRRIR